MDHYQLLGEYVAERITDFHLISGERKESLEQLALSVRDDMSIRNRSDLIFICTHNSRRSHMGQLWAQLAADFYRVEGISCYSGGTEVTAFNPRAVQALESAGFSVSRQDESQNPVYLVKFPGADLGISSFSKKYSDPPNPTEHFIAVMTCSDADEACPIVYGASARHTITYEDPKRFDSTPEEKAKYNERCGQIATEMLYLFSRI